MPYDKMKLEKKQKEIIIHFFQCFRKFPSLSHSFATFPAHARKYSIR